MPRIDSLSRFSDRHLSKHMNFNFDLHNHSTIETTSQSECVDDDSPFQNDCVDAKISAKNPRRAIFSWHVLERKEIELRLES